MPTATHFGMCSSGLAACGGASSGGWAMQHFVHRCGSEGWHQRSCSPESRLFGDSAVSLFRYDAHRLVKPPLARWLWCFHRARRRTDGAGSLANPRLDWTQIAPPVFVATGNRHVLPPVRPDSRIDRAWQAYFHLDSTRWCDRDRAPGVTRGALGGWDIRHRRVERITD